jgi:hypothetical protein
MDFLDGRYAGGNRQTIQLAADLERGWGRINGSWGFDRTVWLPYERESKFRCRVRVVAVGPTSPVDSELLPTHFRSFDSQKRLGRNLVFLKESILIVNFPLDQEWQPAKESRDPLIYEIGDPLFETTMPNDCKLGMRMQLWVVEKGPTCMFVRNQYERGDGFAWIGGRPESNRRKF